MAVAADAARRAGACPVAVLSCTAAADSSINILSRGGPGVKRLGQGEGGLIIFARTAGDRPRDALEHPAAGKFGLAPISRLGLLTFEPSAMVRPDGERLAFLGDVTWQECPKDYDGFLGFLDGVVTALEMPDGPPSAPRCG